MLAVLFVQQERLAHIVQSTSRMGSCRYRMNDLGLGDLAKDAHSWSDISFRSVWAVHGRETQQLVDATPLPDADGRPPGSFVEVPVLSGELTVVPVCAPSGQLRLKLTVEKGNGTTGSRISGRMSGWPKAVGRVGRCPLRPTKGD